jgi:hypothetical protein
VQVREGHLNEGITPKLRDNSLKIWFWVANGFLLLVKEEVRWGLKNSLNPSLSPLITGEFCQLGI